VWTGADLSLPFFLLCADFPFVELSALGGKRGGASLTLIVQDLAATYELFTSHAFIAKLLDR